MLLRKMLRDMKLFLPQFISVFLLSLLGVFVFAGIQAEWYGMQKESDRFYRQSHLADFWVMGSDISGETADKARETAGVDAVQRRLVLDGVADVEGSPVLRLNLVDENTLSLPLTTAGEEFDPGKDGIWLDEKFARAHSLEPGSSITVDFHGQKLEKKVKGLILHPEYVYNVKDDSQFMPDAKSFGFAYIPAGSVHIGKPLPFNQLLVSIREGAKSDEVKAALEDRLAGSYSMILERKAHPSVAMFNSEIEQNRALGGIFPFVFFLIAALTMLTTMTRMVSSQRTQIGTLKALGFSKRKILLHYISYGIWTGLAGGLAGLIAGPLVIPPLLFTMQSSIYNLPHWYGAISAVDISAVVVAVLCCVLSGYFACRRELREVPAATLRPRPLKTGKHTRLEKSFLWRKLGFAVQWNIRDIVRSKVRSIMAIAGVAGCMTLLLWGLGLRDSVNFVTGWLYGDINIYSSKITFAENIGARDLGAITGKFGGQLVQEQSAEIRKGDTVESGSLTVAGEGDELRFFNKDKARMELPAQGAAISGKMANLLGIGIGDEIQWRVYGEKEWQKAPITAIYRTPLGQGLAMSQAAYEKMGKTMNPTALLCPEDAASASSLSGVAEVQDKASMIAGFDSILDSMQLIIAILILAAVLLGSVVLYNLGTLSFAERTRELATLRVLGFPNRLVKSLLQGQNTVLTAAGILIGIPAGYLFIDFMLSTMSDSSDFISHVSLLSLLLCIAGTFAVSFAVEFLLSGRVKSIDMVSSLKSVE